MSYLRYLLLCLCVCGSMVQAKGYAPAVAKNTTGFDIKFASNGTPLANMSNTSTGVAVGSAVALPLSSSVIIQAAATGAIGGASAAGAWGAAFGALGGVALLAAPQMLNMLAKTKHTYNPVTNQFMAQNDSLNCPVSASSLSPSLYANDGNFTVSFMCRPYAPDPKIAEYGWFEACTAYSWCPHITIHGRAPYVLAGGPDTVSSLQAVLNRMTANAPTQAEVQALIDLNFPPVVELPNVTGSPRAYLGNTIQMFSPNEKKTIESWANMDYTQPGKVGVQLETVTKLETAAQTSTSVTRNADGTTSTTSIFTPAQVVTTTVKDNGLTKTTSVTSSDGSTVTVASPTTKADEPTITCGLPGTPPCKIDETGTKTDAATTYDQPKTKIDEAKSAAEVAIGSAANIAAPAWSFTFQLPTGCAPYVTGIKGVILNVCQYQSTIHGLLSVIWAAATAFAMIGMVGRTIREA